MTQGASIYLPGDYIAVFRFMHTIIFEITIYIVTSLSISYVYVYSSILYRP